jgi:multicomponent Na+:H+ antiporter subunit C
MSEAQIYGLCGAGLVGIGLYGALVGRSALRRLLAFNLLGGGVFLVFGAIARRGGLVAGVLSDPVPQALVITGLVVAFAATALAVALLIRIRDVSAWARRGARGLVQAGRAATGAGRAASRRPGRGRAFVNLIDLLAPWLAGPRAPELLFPLLALPVLGLLLAPLLGARGARLLALSSLVLGLALALACAAGPDRRRCAAGATRSAAGARPWGSSYTLTDQRR